MSPWVSELNRLEHHLWTARVSMRKLPCTQLRSSFFILAATFSLEILGFEAAATEKKPAAKKPAAKKELAKKAAPKKKAAAKKKASGGTVRA